MLRTAPPLFFTVECYQKVKSSSATEKMNPPSQSTRMRPLGSLWTRLEAK
jgi:hypothetical protein